MPSRSGLEGKPIMVLGGGQTLAGGCGAMGVMDHAPSVRAQGEGAETWPGT
jgi:hypothetical protein